MKELIRSNDPVLISVIKDALSSKNIDFFEFDQNISSAYAGIETFPSRIMVLDDDIELSLSIAKAICPEYFR